MSATCEHCRGPNDALHTPQECSDLAGLNDVTDGRRVSVALVAGMLAHADNPLCVASRLREMGIIRDLQ